MEIQWKISAFTTLSTEELYQVLRLRSEIFVVEQDCVYQDLDGKDQQALHLTGKISGTIVAYARLFAAGDYFEEASIGRVVVAAKVRGQSIGHQLMRNAINGIYEEFKSSMITISAQAYLEKFYMQHGFRRFGEQYLEDGIPHIKMKRT